MRLAMSVKSSDEVENRGRQVQGRLSRTASIVGLENGGFQVRCILVTVQELVNPSS